MNPDFLQTIWTFAVTVACYLAVASELISPKFETMSVEDVDQAIAIYDEMIRLDSESPETYLRRGFARLNRHDIDNAIDDFDIVVCLDPDSAQAYLFRAAAWIELKGFDRAMTDTDEAIRLSPQSRQAYLQRGLIWQLKSDFDKSLADYDQAIKLDPDHSQSYAVRSMVRLSRKEHSLALADIDKALELDPDASNNYANRACILVEQQNSEQAFADFAEAIRLNPRNANAHVNRGLFHNHRTEWDQAIQDLSEGIRLCPTNTQAYYQRGLAFHSKGTFQRAIADFGEVLKQMPDDFDSYANRGATLADAKRFHEAIQDFNNALRLKPQNVDALVMRGRCYFSVDDIERAIADMNEAIRIEPRRASSYLFRGGIRACQCRKSNSQDEQDLALADFDAAQKLDPHEARIYLDRALHYGWQNKFGLSLLNTIKADELNPALIPADHLKEISNLAKQAADRILVGLNDENPNDLTFAEACFDRGVAHYVLKRDEAALKDLGDAIHIDPGFSLSYSFRGRTHLRNKRWDAAIQDFDSAIRLTPDDAFIWMARGQARAAKKEWVAACDDFREAIRLDQRLIRAFAHRGAAWQAMQEWEEAIADYNHVTHSSPLIAHAPKDRIPASKTATPAAPMTGLKGDSKIVNVFEMVAKPSKGIFSHPNGTPPGGAAGFFSSLPQAITTTTQNVGETPMAQPATNQTPNPGSLAGSDVELDPVYLKAYQNRAECHEALQEWTRAIADYQRLIELAPAEGLAYRRIAWLKATCITPDVRNGVDAVSFATQAKQRSMRTDPEDLIVLAAAYAEAGDFVTAVDYQSRACDLVVRSSEKEYQARRQHFASLEFQQSLSDDKITSTKDSAAIDALNQSCEQSGWSDAGMIQSLADACADAGQFSRAIEFHEKAYAITSEVRNKPLLERLELYRAEKPYRDTSLAKGSIVANDRR